MGNKQDELELLVQQGKCYLIAMMETRWDDSYVLNVETEGYNLLKRNRNNRKVGGNALYLKIRLLSSEIQVKGFVILQSKVFHFLCNFSVP